MDSKSVLQELNNTWEKMLDKFYDGVVDEFITWMAKEHNMDIKVLREKAAPLKERLIANASNNINSIKTTKKNVNKPKHVDNSIYSSKTRKELIELCQQRHLPVKRKNLDMINNLIAWDENSIPKEEDSSKDDEKKGEEIIEHNEESKTKVKKEGPKHKQKKTCKPIVSKNELVEELISSDDES